MTAGASKAKTVLQLKGFQAEMGQLKPNLREMQALPLARWSMFELCTRRQSWGVLSLVMGLLSLFTLKSVA